MNPGSGNPGTGTVHTERHGDVALLVFDNPPVNALSTAMRQALREAFTAAMDDPGVAAVVIAGAGRTFVAGADIREFDAPPPPPQMMSGSVFDQIENAPKPVVAALHGTALGGGFELTLACHERVMAPDARVGLPEVRIGLIPGAGGTQRVPRLAGAMVALDLATSGRQVAADEALKLGLVDEIATDIRAAAMARARALAAAGTWPRSGQRPVPPVDRLAFDAAVAAVRKRARGAEAPVAAAEAVRWALDLPFAEACAKERAESQRLRRAPQSRALRHLFHAERLAARIPTVGGRIPSPWPVARTGVVGGGTMGSGIAIALASAGLPVVLVEADEAAAAAAEARVRAVLDRQVKGGRLAPAARAERLGRITFCADLLMLADVDLVIEAIIEELGAKETLFRRLSAVTRRDAILASNTSRLDVDLLADVVDAPERVLGLHFFSPAHVMRLVEVVRTPRTAGEVLATAITLAKRLHKLPVVSGICDGFIGNRILSRWRTQCDYLLEDGAMPEQVDAALEAYGFAMGPYAVADLAGLDIGWAGRKRAAAARDPRVRYVQIADWICEMGRFGQKTGAGYYRHDAEGRHVDPVVTELVLRASREKGILRREVKAEEIVARVHAAMVNEAAKILAEGIAQRPSDIDLVLVNGYGYPAWRGGPMHEADEKGIRAVLAEIEAMAAASGHGWEPAPLLREMAEAGRSFADMNI
jgi:3-hydroxyacyl-CoA dehydrogenase